MKFNPTWSQVALLLGMIAAVVLAHAFAPPAVGVVTSIVSTVVGALFVNLKKEEKAGSSLDDGQSAKKDAKGKVWTSRDSGVTWTKEEE